MTTPIERTMAHHTASAVKGNRSSDMVATILSFIELTKPRITTLVVATAAGGFLLASRGSLSWTGLLNLAAGITLLSSGIGTLNQYLERDLDGLMKRTSQRPLPSGKLAAWKALAFGVVLSVAAILYLAVAFNPLTSLLGAATLVSYLFLYTPLKTKSTISTTVGAFPGAMPPLVGWVAARGSMGIEALVLFAILFFWQFPHFLSIAWMYRDDYARAGMKMLPVIESDGRVTSRHMVFYSAVLLPVSLLPSFVHLAGPVYLAGAAAIGIWFLAVSVRTLSSRTAWQARRVLRASVIYLPILFALMVFNF